MVVITKTDVISLAYRISKWIAELSKEIFQELKINRQKYGGERKEGGGGRLLYFIKQQTERIKRHYWTRLKNVSTGAACHGLCCMTQHSSGEEREGKNTEQSDGEIWRWYEIIWNNKEQREETD